MKPHENRVGFQRGSQEKEEQEEIVGIWFSLYIENIEDISLTLNVKRIELVKVFFYKL